MIGGTPDELQLIARGLDALARHYTFADRAVPDDVRKARAQVSSALANISDLPTALTVPEAAAQVRMSERTIERAYTSGALSVARIGAAVRIRPDALVAWVESCERAS